MTLSPIFRSPDYLEILRRQGYLDKLGQSIAEHKEALKLIDSYLGQLIDNQYISSDNSSNMDADSFLQEHFFMILFYSIFESLGINKEHLRVYQALNQSIKGIIVSGDNIFDKQKKMALNLNLSEGINFLSIIQLLCCISIIFRILEDTPWILNEKIRIVTSNLLNRLIYIGALEGSEEEGIENIMPVNKMIEHVHRVRGGALFSLAFIAPKAIENNIDENIWKKVEEGVGKIGTAFQIVDDIVDFEFDLNRRSHNILFAQITHHGTEKEKRLLNQFMSLDSIPLGIVEESFLESASEVLRLSYLEAKSGFTILQEEVGFWMKPEDSKFFVRAIVNIEGVERVSAINF